MKKGHKSDGSLPPPPPSPPPPPPPLPLPEDIIYDIFLRVPARCLCKCKCVSTQWRSMIDNPLFISAHLAKSSARPQLLISFDGEYCPAMPREKFFFSVENSNNLSHTVRYRCRIDYLGDFISQAGGLICSFSSQGIHVCNPTSGELIAFPKTIVGICKPFFLGHDPVENKYIIISLPACFAKRELLRQFHVLTLGEKEWTRIDIDPGVPTGTFSASLCFDGVLYIVGKKGYLLVFDVRHGTYWFITLPKDCRYYYTTSLVNYHGCLAILDYWSRHINIRIWILEDVVEQVWSYQEFIPSPVLTDTLLKMRHNCDGMTREGELMISPMLSVERWGFYLYHLEDATLRKIEISGFHERVSALSDMYDGGVRVCYHVESPQSLKEFRIDQEDAMLLPL